MPGNNKEFPFRWAVRTDIGRVRDKNEDRYMIRPEAGLFLVSDGMGGHPGGDAASGFVSEYLSARIEKKLGTRVCPNPRSIRRILKVSIQDHNQEMLLERQKQLGFENMGATVVLCLIIGGRAYVANLGDSRLYRLRKKRFVQISRDHSVVGELIEAGNLAADKAGEHAERGLLTQYVGMEELPEPHIRSFALCYGDRLLLCSDGLTDMICEKRIRAILLESDLPGDAARRLSAEANEAGGYDNITVVVIDCI